MYSSVRKFYWNEGQDNWNKTYTKLGGGGYSSVSIVERGNIKIGETIPPIAAGQDL